MTRSSPHLPFFIGMRLVSQGTYRFLYPFLPIVASGIGLTTARSGLLLSALAMGGLFAPPLRRMLTGTHEQHRKLIVRGGLIAGVGALIAAWASIAPVVVVGILLFGIGKPLGDIGVISYVSVRVTSSRLARATSTLELTWAGGLIFVAPVAGALADLFSWRVPLACLAVMMLMFTGVAAVRLDKDSAGQRTTPTDAAPLGRAASLYLLVAFLMFSAQEVTFAAFGVWLVDAFGTTTGELGAFAALSAVGELIGAAAVLFFGDRFGSARFLAAGLVVITIGGCALPLVTSATMAAGAFGILILGAETALVAGIALAAGLAPHARTRFFARMFATASVARLLTAGLAPLIYTTFGIIGNAAVAVTAAVLALLSLRLVLRAEDAAAPDARREPARA